MKCGVRKVKAIAIIDKKPERCIECQFCCESNDKDQFGLPCNRKYYCKAIGYMCNHFKNEEDLYKYCPLKEVPEWVLDKIVGDSK